MQENAVTHYRKEVNDLIKGEKMEKVNTASITTDIFVDDKNVGNFTLTTFNDGTMNANFMINDASIFHSSAEAAQDLVNLVNDSISKSKTLTAIKAD